MNTIMTTATVALILMPILLICAYMAHRTRKAHKQAKSEETWLQARGVKPVHPINIEATDNAEQEAGG